MYAPHHVSAARHRQGVILMVVLALLTLFAIVGLSFVYYADAQAKASQIDREAQTQTQAEIEPEHLLNYFMGQLAYDTDNQSGVYSALRGHSLGRSMYGYNDSAGIVNMVPFNGVGRVHAPGFFGQDDYNFVNYTYFPRDTTNGQPNGPPLGLRDPERLGTRANPNVTPNPNPFAGVNAPYTYPDINNMYLAAVKADGTVLLPSFHRPWTVPGGFPLWFNNAPHPNWFVPSTTNPALKYQVLRPRPADHFLANEIWDAAQNMPYNTVTKTYRANFFPPPADAGGDVKNLTWAPGGNDSIWLDAGYPVLTAPDGKKYKPLFAPLITDLDNRVNLNVHGNIKGQGNTHVSNQGWGPWTVNVGTVVNQGTEWNQLFQRPPANTVGPFVYGRYGRNNVPENNGSNIAVPVQPGVLPTSGPHFYAPVDYDGCDINGMPTQQLIPVGNGLSPFPAPVPGYDNGSAAELANHPSVYNFFQPGGDDRLLPLSGMEALLRFGDTGYASLVASDLLRLCPANFNNPNDLPGSLRRRQLVTLRSSDFDVPGVVPYLWQFGPTATYQLSAGSSYPMGPPIGFPMPANSPTQATQQPGSEFSQDWRALSAALGRLDLNRSLPDYPPLQNGQITDVAGYQAAVVARQQLAQDIFTALRAATVTTLAPLPNPLTNKADYDAQRWLAQLAVNIVDFIDSDDNMTPFYWNPSNPNEVVFGTELPRVVINEAYAEFTPPTPVNVPLPGNWPAGMTQVQVWVELLNTFNSDPSLVSATGNGGDAPLFIPGVGACYQLAICWPDRPGVPNPPNPSPYYRRADNVWGSFYPVGAGDNSMVYPTTVGGPPTTGVAGGALQPTDAGSKTWAPGNPPNPVTISAFNGLAGPQGYFLAGPAPLAGGGPTPTSPDPNMGYQVNTAANKAPTAPTVVLQRLACPYRPHDPNQVAGGVPNPNYNPYVTVDYMQNVNADPAGLIRAKNNALGQSLIPKLAVNERQSEGRSHPYAGFSQLGSPYKQLQIGTGGAGQPQTTFLAVNNPNPANLAWLVHLDRQLTSPMELLHVSAFKPHELTQEFNPPLPPPTPTPTQFHHRVPWLDEDLAPGSGSHRLYRFFEFAGTRGRAAGLAATTLTGLTDVQAPSTPGQPRPNVTVTVQPTSGTFPAAYGLTSSGVPWSIQVGQVVVVDQGLHQENVRVKGVTPTSFTADFYKPHTAGSFTIALTTLGDRVPGKININTIWDPEVFVALCDPQVSNNFQLADLYDPTWMNANVPVYNRLITLRTPGLVPTVPPGTPPISGNDMPFWSTAMGVYSPGPPPDSQFPNYGINNTLLRASTAAGPNNSPRLFEPTSPNPPTPGSTSPYWRSQLLNKVSNNITTRSNVFAVWVTVGFFEVIDDTTRPVTLGAEVGSSTGKQVRHRMFAIVDRTGMTVPSQVTTLQAAVTSTGQQTVQVGQLGTLTLQPPSTPMPWLIRPGDTVVIDAGTNYQESVVVQQTIANPPAITATFTKQHPINPQGQPPSVSVYIVPGNPGPQPQFNARDPVYSAVVPYFSIIQ